MYASARAFKSNKGPVSRAWDSFCNLGGSEMRRGSRFENPTRSTVATASLTKCSGNVRSCLTSYPVSTFWHLSTYTWLDWTPFGSKRHEIVVRRAQSMHIEKFAVPIAGRYFGLAYRVAIWIYNDSVSGTVSGHFRLQVTEFQVR